MTSIHGSPAKCLVLGIGNLLLSDEGIGVHAVQALGRADLPSGVDLLDGGTGGFHLLSCFRDYDTVIIVDAALDGKPPGTVTVTEPRFANDFPRVLSSHDIGLRDTIESAQLLGDLPAMYLVAISIKADQPMGTELSATVQASIAAVVARVHWIVSNLNRSVDDNENLLGASGGKYA